MSSSNLYAVNSLILLCWISAWFAISTWSMSLGRIETMLERMSNRILLTYSSVSLSLLDFLIFSISDSYAAVAARGTDKALCFGSYAAVAA